MKQLPIFREDLQARFRKDEIQPAEMNYLRGGDDPPPPPPEPPDDHNTGG